MIADVCVIGGGPAGLRAAEVAAEGGARVCVFDAMPSVGRKFLIAGRGGLNLTSVVETAEFLSSYTGGDSELWKSLLADFSPEDLRAWARGLGIETIAASNSRVYPIGLKSAPLLRRWVQRLRAMGVEFRPRHRWVSLHASSLNIGFTTPDGPATFETKALILALGGGSWPQTGSDATWVSVFRGLVVEVTPLLPANCGWHVAWTSDFRAKHAGKPLKNISATANDHRVPGELLVTDYGLEGGPLYALGRSLRAGHDLFLDLRPAFTQEQLLSRLPQTKTFHWQETCERWRLPEIVRDLLESHPDRPHWTTAQAFAAVVKRCPILIAGPRPLAEAISTAGGVSWQEVSDGLMLKKHPGVFVCGEMLDWEAPTGGFLMQGAFSTGTRAGREALKSLQA